MPAATSQRKLVVGCGYLGNRVAARWLSAGNKVFAVTRSDDRATELRRQGLSPIVLDLAIPQSVHDLPDVRTVLYAVGFDPKSGRSRCDIHIDGLKRLLDGLPGSVERLIYVSTVGVYGQTDGEWVDEDSPCIPSGESGEVYVEAERLLMDHPLGRRAMILRLAGIYGPGRVPRREALVSGEPLLAAQGYLNLIHVDDAVQVVLDAERLAVPPRMYCVSDGHPVLRNEYYSELARLWDAPASRFADAGVEKHRSGRGTSNKRVSNQRMLRELRTSLEFPDYRLGLASIVSHRER